MTTAKQKYILLSDQETAKILKIRINKLYEICSFFDDKQDDEWDLIEGEHFEWVRKDVGKRKFYEAGAVAIAKYMYTIADQRFLAGLVNEVIEAFTHRRKRIRRHLLRRKVAIEFASLNDAKITKELVFLARPKIIRILETNGKGLNASIRRIQDNDSLEGKQQLKPDEDYKVIDDLQHWSQRGIAKLAEDMTINHKKQRRSSRQAWTETAFEEIEDAIEKQREYLESSESRIRKAIDKAKRLADNRCQVSLKKRTPSHPFDLHAHHLFDKASRPDLADVLENLLVMHSEIHQGFHQWHGCESCEPRDFIEYLLHAEGAIFESNKNAKNLDLIIHKLERVQSFFEDCYHMP